MATYILLMTLTPEGQAQALEDPEYMLHVHDEVNVGGVQSLGLYAVLGQYDFVLIVDAGNNDEVARFSIEFGVKAKVHVTTLPVVPISHLEPARPPLLERSESGADMPSD
jgi:uncharacterized protein with GYD domain